MARILYTLEPNTGKRNQVNSTRNRRIELKANTPGPLERTNLKHKRKKQIIFDAFYKI